MRFHSLALPLSRAGTESPLKFCPYTVKVGRWLRSTARSSDPRSGTVS
jgi:hypothetical protein